MNDVEEVSSSRGLYLRQLRARYPKGRVPARLRYRPTEKLFLCPLEPVCTKSQWQFLEFEQTFDLMPRGALCKSSHPNRIYFKISRGGKKTYEKCAS